MGALAGGKVANMLGMGDYSVNKNSLISDLGSAGPVGKRFSFSETGTANIRLRKREYLGIITGPTTPGDFHTQRYRIQCADEETFPYASKIAVLFAEWKVHGMIFSFESTSSNYAQDLGLGTVAMATHYNANQPPFGSMEEILQSAYHTRGNPSEDMLHGIECDPKLQAADRLYTRRPGCQGPPNLYDHGVFTLATEGLPTNAAGVSLGRLYVTYDIELSIPELPQLPPFANLFAVGYALSVATTEPPLGTQVTMLQEPGSQLTISSSPGANVLKLSPGPAPQFQPTQTADQEIQLMVWTNGNSGNTRQQFLSFARAGVYNFSLYRVSPAIVTAGSDVIAVFGDAEIVALVSQEVGTYQYCKEMLIKINQPGAGFSIENFANDTASVWWQLST